MRVSSLKKFNINFYRYVILRHYFQAGGIVSDTQFSELNSLANNAKIISSLKFLLIRYFFYIERSNDTLVIRYIERSPYCVLELRVIHQILSKYFLATEILIYDWNLQFQIILNGKWAFLREVKLFSIK